MKYNTIIVPVMFAALTAAAATEHKSDQGTYRPQSKVPLSTQKSQDSAREGSRRPPVSGEQGAVPPAPVRNAASEAPKPGSAPSEAKDKAEDVRAANSPADPRPVDMVSDAQPGEVPYQAKDQADAARQDGPGGRPSQAIRKAEGVHPADITVEAPRPAGEQRLPPQPPRLRRLSRSHAARAEMSEK
ncbi:hypothetical protein M408DRAFT_94093 [Serendipita vermifera MAFF 305830]|uniref:Uncharacterized protein n=1 Tax=Serendipita vermifera MAFF 305830 TaxID=933852 RepID=A0A0C3BQF3_SERVB|nr:hypothetical protein M408DRAFT_94093 [Serendipita vermifera MAFF 305830]